MTLPWEATDCETHEFVNPVGASIVFRTLVGTVGRMMPPINVTTVPVPTGHGSIYLASAHLERPVALTVALPGVFDGRTELRQWARILDPRRGEGTLTVVQGDYPGRLLHCVYEAGLDDFAETSANVMSGTLVFRAAWPYWEDAEPETVTFDSDDLGDSFTVENNGDAPAWPVITVVGPAEGITVTNETTGREWTWDDNLLGGDILEVDTRPGHKTVTHDGVNAFGSLTDTSILWPLQRGPNDVSMDATAITSASTLTFEWVKQWLAA